MKHSEGNFRGQGNLNLYYQRWLPPEEARAVLIVVHGLAEHSGRYRNLVNHFVPRGFAIYSFDQRGHGHSEGQRGYVERFSHFVNDLDTFLGIVRRQHQESKIFIVGHSMGGTIATAYAVNHQHQFDGLITSGAVLKLSPSTALIALARLLSWLLPKSGLTRIDASTISQDETVVNAYINDRLVYRGKIRARLGSELLKATQILPRRMPEIKLPILIMHGASDRLSEPEGSEILYQRVASSDKTLKLYQGFYHEIFNEPGWGQVFADMESWLDAHL